MTEGRAREFSDQDSFSAQGSRLKAQGSRENIEDEEDRHSN
jgi:hypothetical protein